MQSSKDKANAEKVMEGLLETYKERAPYIKGIKKKVLALIDIQEQFA